MTVLVVAVIAIVRTLLGATWEIAISEIDVLYWIYVVVIMSLYNGWLRKRKESVSAV